MTLPDRAPRALWMLSLAVALAFLVIDSSARLRRVDALTTATTESAQPVAANPATPSGNAGNQHTLVLGNQETDGYEWLMQTQLMVANGGARLRWVNYEGPPGGRATHWSGSLRWWTLLWAWGASRISGDSLAHAIESVSPWVNVAFLAAFLLIVTPVIARRFGALPGALFPLGMVAISPVYDAFAVGNLDHHGLVACAAMLSVIFLIGGGAGWISESAHRADSLAQWLPDVAQARRWFISAGVAGGAGLWISAATEIPVLLGIGVAVAAAALMGARSNERTDAWRTEPGLWRIWGVAGAATSLLLYLLEYFPSHLGLRLEVNHPLYALAWLAGGDLLFRISRRGVLAREAAWIACDAIIVAIPPIVAWLVPASFALRPGSLLIALHEDYIGEFQTLAMHLFRGSWVQYDLRASLLLPLLVAGPAVVLCFARRVAPPVRAIAVLSAVPPMLFTLLALRHERWIDIACALWIVTMIAVSAIANPGWRGTWRWMAVRVMLAGAALSLPFAVVPALVPHVDNAAGNAAGNALVRGLTAAVASVAVFTGPALWVALAMIVLLAVVLARMTLTGSWTRGWLLSSGFALGLVLLPAPIKSLHTWIVSGWRYPVGPGDFTEVVARDVSYKLRARLGDEMGMVAAEPTVTTWMTYFGGVRGLGTLYWENARGLEEAATLFGAPAAGNADSAFHMISKLGVTHVVLYAGDPFVEEYARLSFGGRVNVAPSDADARAIRSAFGPSLLRGSFPSWLRPLPYRPPAIPGAGSPSVLVLEVVPAQTPDEAATRYAQYSLAMRDREGGVRRIDSVLARSPQYLPALIALARIQSADSGRAAFAATVRRIVQAGGADSLALEDDIGLASVFALAGDTLRSRVAMLRAIARSDERSIRHLSWSTALANFVVLTRRYQLENMRRDIISLAVGLLDPAVRSQIERGR